ncbi:hypothetical protein B0H15DRAFT_521840 [Mycena belliarum]|uniref:Uncharacterized protein n=1 Tax=Mycena belliarum TaxID=1033014 RepID=A0AAD6TYU3_9AGAR|nr:hypothetical protein B0H15DRAFT_521840 [Mycena belliae]
MYVPLPLHLARFVLCTGLLIVYTLNRSCGRGPLLRSTRGRLSTVRTKRKPIMCRIIHRTVVLRQHCDFASATFDLSTPRPFKPVPPEPAVSPRRLLLYLHLSW